MKCKKCGDELVYGRGLCRRCWNREYYKKRRDHWMEVAKMQAEAFKEEHGVPMSTYYERRREKLLDIDQGDLVEAVERMISGDRIDLNSIFLDGEFLARVMRNKDF